MASKSGTFFRIDAAHPLAGRTVLQIIPQLRAGAAARAAIDTAAALSKAGARALVASRGGPMVSELQAKGGLFVPFPADAKNPLAMAWNVRRLARLIKIEKVDIAHALSRAPAWVAYGATRLTKKPFVTNFQGGCAGGGVLDARYNSIMARGDVIIADSIHAAGLLAKLHPAAEGKIRVVLHGVECRTFAPKAVDPARVQALRRDWKVASDEIVILLAADARAPAEGEILVETARILIARGLTGVKFILASDEPGRGRGADLDQAIAAARLQDILRRVGQCADMPAALLAASVVITPATRPEALSAVALEAQAIGTPVITADQGAAAESVLAPPGTEADARTGWRTPAGDAAALAAAAIEALSLGATARERLSLRARAHAEAHFSLEHIGSQMLAAYMAALGAEPGSYEG